MIDPTNQFVRECIEVGAAYSSELERVLAVYDAASKEEQRKQFETMLQVAIGALAKLASQRPAGEQANTSQQGSN